MERIQTLAGSGATLILLFGALGGAMALPRPYAVSVAPPRAEPTSLPLSQAAPEPAAPAPPAIRRFGAGLEVDRSEAPVQCAVYARRRTGFELYGNAAAWWARAEGQYLRSGAPSVGAAMIMGGTRRGHVAVVTEVRGPREIVIDHANWLGSGEIIRGAIVIDVSDLGDWSQVRVGRPPDNEPGSRIYPVTGFISAMPEPAPSLAAAF